MITFLSSPKPFTGAAKDIQYRAIRNWQWEVPNGEVILYGDSPGIVEAGKELGVLVVRDVQCSATGAPFFGAIAEYAARQGKHGLQVYLNCDILISGILAAMQRLEFPHFLLIGERIDLAEGVFIDTARPGWKEELLRGKALLHGPTGIDYFGFRRGLWRDLPPVIIGRGAYDNALMAYCFRKRVPIVDGTYAVLALHQFHGYGHVSGGKQTVFWGSESDLNCQAAGGRRSATLVSDADYVLRESKLIQQPCRGDRLRRLELLCRYTCGYPRVGLTLRILWRALAAAGLRRPHPLSMESLLAQDLGGPSKYRNCQ